MSSANTLFHSFEKAKWGEVSDIFYYRKKKTDQITGLDRKLVLELVAVREIAEQNKMWLSCEHRDSPYSSLHVVSQVKKITKTNGIILVAYTEELYLFQICETLVPN